MQSPFKVGLGYGMGWDGMGWDGVGCGWVGVVQLKIELEKHHTLMFSKPFS